MDNAKIIQQKIRNFTSREQKLHQDKEELLRDQGWSASSSYPDCCWRWSKNLGTEHAPTFVTVPFNNVDEALELEAKYLELFAIGITIKCPHCEANNEIPDRRYQRISCHACHTNLEVLHADKSVEVKILPDNPSPIAKGAL